MVAISPKAAEFLSAPHFGKIATVKKDGSPHVTPIWFMLEDGKVIINTTTDRVKYWNVRRDPRVSFLVDDGYPYVMMEGTARVANERDANRDIEALAIRYTGEARGRKSAREVYWKQKRVSLEILPHKVIEAL